MVTRYKQRRLTVEGPTIYIDVLESSVRICKLADVFKIVTLGCEPVPIVEYPC